MNQELIAVPHDPVVARDGRPFGAQQGNRMRGLSWPTPQMFAGSLRTWLGKHVGDFSSETIENLLKVRIRGPLPVSEGTLYLPAPADLVYRASPRQIFRSRPRAVEDGAIRLPKGVSQLCFLVPEPDEDFKPDRSPPFVSSGWMTKWLLDSGASPPENGECLQRLPIDERTHVAIDPGTYSSSEHLLYSTAGIALTERLAISAYTDLSSVGLRFPPGDRFHPLGGERRLSLWRTAERPSEGWQCPEQVAGGLSSARFVRLILATPGVFSDGWLPGWLVRGEPVPETDVRLRLIAAICGRWEPLSGWNLKAGEEFGPKPVRRLVPAGASYFCEVVSGSTGTLASAWLHSVADRVQDRNDGFALALWGIWKESYV